MYKSYTLNEKYKKNPARNTALLAGLINKLIWCYYKVFLYSSRIISSVTSRGLPGVHTSA